MAGGIPDGEEHRLVFDFGLGKRFIPSAGIPVYRVVGMLNEVEGVIDDTIGLE